MSAPAVMSAPVAWVGAEPERILVRCPNWLGDVVMSTPGFRALRRAHPHSKIVAQIAAPLAPLLEGHPAFDEVWPLNVPLRSPSALHAEAKRIAEARFDLGIAIPESISSALLMRWGRVGCVVGFARDRLRRLLLHREVAAPGEWGRRRLVARERFVLSLMGAVGAESDDTSLELCVTAEEEARLDEALRSARNGGVGRPAGASIVLAPGASFGDSKCWPVESYAALADRLVQRGEQVVLVGSSAERERVESIRSQMDSDCVALAGALDLGALKALLRDARLLVSNDAGARHVAVAFGTPTVVFLGPTSLEKTNENLEWVAALETDHACRPCYRRSCPIDHRCMTQIGVEEALEAIDRMLPGGCERKTARPTAGG